MLLLLLLSRLCPVQFCATQRRQPTRLPPSQGFSRQEHWSGLPCPSPMHESEKRKSWSAGVGCRCLLRLSTARMNNSEVEVDILLKENPRGSDGKNICLQCGRPGFDPWVGKILWRRKWQSTPVLLPGKFHG